MSRCYTQITLADRHLFHHLVNRKVAINERGHRLGRNRSTIDCEIRRNTFHDNQLPEYTGYFGMIADELRSERWRKFAQASWPSRSSC
ncbi:hypothetical protein DC439_25255 (plasmid) [Agrobacterium tumefaciens]|nr:helix-turn-helix domain-containing protein [Agrobacterium tumefaciens]QAA98369.1 hypothetical protein DC439_12275 [Agrobacterium tumefaciens]QAB01106.1 hypothetical protein DC439_25255 [Agrobacterium tumefaciens]